MTPWKVESITLQPERRFDMATKDPLIHHGTSKTVECGDFQYCVQRKECRQVGVEQALTPEMPPNGNWELISVSIEGSAVFFYWKRRVRGRWSDIADKAFPV